MNSFINLAHLKFFCDTVIHNSMSEAAKINYITQPAISQAITKLESFFGSALLISSKQKIVLTDQGHIVFKQALEIFKSVNDTMSQINHTYENVAGVVKFATSKSLSMSFFAPTYTKMRKLYPLVELKIETGSKSYIRNLLKLEEVEFAIVVYDDYNFAQYEKQTIKKGVFNLYSSKLIEAESIPKEIFVDYEASLYVQELKDFISKNDYTTNVKVLAGWELVANFSNLGAGVGFFPDYLASFSRHPNLVRLPINLPPFEYEIAVIYNKSATLSRAACAFIDQFCLE